MITELIATIGPSSQKEETVIAMAEAGMTTMRANFSHCSEDEYKERVAFRDAASTAVGRQIKLLADLQGPRIRVRNVPEGGRTVVAEERVVFTTADADPEEGVLRLDDPYLHQDVKIGDPVLIANGALESVVTEVDVNAQRIVVRMLTDGIIFPNKGVNLPRTKLTTSCLTDKDRKDIAFLNTQPVDMVALSFVQSADDIRELRKLVTNPTIKLIVKIERQEALKHLDEIIEEADGVMIARGDLGVELPYEDLPIVQKQIIRKCHLHLKPAIVATQMLSTMVREPFPTRAEVSDVATAVFDGAHVVMLSDETANGEHPVEAVKTMATIAARVERELRY